MTGTNDVLGTAFVIGDSFTVITCYHLIKEKRTIVYQPADTAAFYLLSLGRVDTAQNIAILRAKYPVGVPVRTAFTDSVELGERIQYFGYDVREEAQEDFVIRTSHARLTARGQMLEQQNPVDFIEFRAADIQGFEGSPVINENGEVIGITMIANTIQGVRSNKRNLVNKAYRIKFPN